MVTEETNSKFISSATISGVEKVQEYLEIYLNDENKFGLAIYENMLRVSPDDLKWKRITIIRTANDEVAQIFDEQNNTLYEYDQEKLDQYKQNRKIERQKKEEIEGFRSEYIDMPEAQDKVENRLAELPENLKQDLFIITYQRPFTKDQYIEIARIYLEYSLTKDIVTKNDMKARLDDKEKSGDAYAHFLKETWMDYIDFNLFKSFVGKMFDYLQESNKHNGSKLADKLEQELEGIDGFIKFNFLKDIRLTPPYSREDYNKISLYSSLLQFLKIHKGSERMDMLWEELEKSGKALNNFLAPGAVVSRIEAGGIMHQIKHRKIMEYLENFMKNWSSHKSIKTEVTWKFEDGLEDELWLNHELWIDAQTVLYIYLRELKGLYDFLKKNNKLDII